jgi:LTXXQ motif family protein
MAKVGALAGAVLIVIATALAMSSGADAKGGGHGRGGGGHHAGGHGKLHFGGGRHHFRAHRGFSRHASRRAGRHFARPMMGGQPMIRGRLGARGWPARFTTGRSHFARRAGFHTGLAASFLARPAFRAAAWPGPFFWSHAADDVFWPTAYDAVFWDYGPADMLGGILDPPYDSFARRGRRGARALARVEEDSARLCRDQPSELMNIAAIEQEVRPREEQRTAFDQLRAAEAGATEIVRGACAGHVPPSPTGRRDAMAQWVDAILVAVRMVRSPLEAFYRSLDDEQKARFAVLRRAGHLGDETEPWLGSCSDPDDVTASVPIRPLVRRLKLSETQAAALEDFSRASDEAAKKLQASCPRDAPLTPTGRIAAIEARLTALTDALATMRAPLDRFYGSLSDEQKAQFDRIGGRAARRGG